MELNERIALARKQAGLSQEQLGERLNVSRQAVSKWESGQSNPDITYVAAMCRLFGVSSDWLLLGEDNAADIAPARCPACRTVVTGLDNFCPNCGRNLQENACQTYTLLLRSGSAMTLLEDDLRYLSRSGLLPENSPVSNPFRRSDVQRLDQAAPLILSRGLRREQVGELWGRLYQQNRFAIYRDSDGQTPEQLLEQTPVDAGSFNAVNQPLSFGMTVLAVIAGSGIVALLLLFL